MSQEFNSFTKFAKNTLILSQEQMRLLNDSQVQTQHLLLGLLKQPKSLASEILKNFGVTYENAFRISSELKGSKNKISLEGKNLEEKNTFSPFAQKVIETAAKSAIKFEHSSVDSEHILYALLKQKNSGAVHILTNLMLKPEQVLDYLENLFKKSHSAQETSNVNSDISSLLDGLQNLLVGIGINNQDKSGGGGQFSSPNFFSNENVMGGDIMGDSTSQPPQKNSRKKRLALDYFCDDFTEMAADGKIETIVGRDKEIERMIQILSRKTKNNPVLLGDPGVGKTAIAEGLALRIAEGTVPDSLVDKRVMSLSMANLVAGTKYRGEFEERIKRIIEEASASDNEVILFIDELHTIIGAGGSEGSLDAANILKPALSRGAIQVIGATTIEEYRKYIEKDSALARRFQSVNVPEPTIDQAIDILRGIKKHYEKYHVVNISDEAVIAAVKMSARYINDRFLPDKAFDLLDEACAKKSLTNRLNGKEVREKRKVLTALQRKKEEAVISQNYEKANKYHLQEQVLEKEISELKHKKIAGKSPKNIDRIDIAKVLEQTTDIPVTKLLNSDLKSLQSLEKTLQKYIIGQDEAVSIIAKSVRRARLQLQDPNRPLGAFLFLGPTGVGKTELVKNLAKEIYNDEKSLIKIDMSEFSEGHTGSRLVGATAGYIGHEDGGELTEKVRRRPYSIVLFDEIEKAHKNVHNMLLQIFEDGQLTDGKGRTVSFRNTVVIMTSNIGASRFQQNANMIGFGATKKDLSEHEEEFKSIKEDVQKDLKKSFTPEFLNRLDSTVVFHPLNRESIKKIVKIHIQKLQARLREKNITLKIGGSDINALAKAAYNPEFGAREVRRVIADKIENPLAEEMINGKIVENKEYKVSCKKDQFCTFKEIK
jgi:ATP-dependent Clp protease ATP-binding subunit ClpC